MYNTSMTKNNKTGVKKSPVKKTSAEAILARELCSLIPKLDAEGLAFLVKQAKIHIYNTQVDELNKAAADVYMESARAKTSVKPKKTAAQVNPKKDRFNINATGAGYYLRYQNDGVIFSKTEMAQLVKIINGPGTNTDIIGRLYNWLARERKDIFAAIPIADRSDARLKSLAALIKKNF